MLADASSAAWANTAVWIVAIVCLTIVAVATIYCCRDAVGDYVRAKARRDFGDPGDPDYP